jgi:uncharacterized protein (TIGR02145 family)
MKLRLLATASFFVTIIQAQNVGIGTKTPTQKLDVRGKTTDDGVLISVGNADASHQLGLYGGRLNDPNPFIIWKAGDPLRFATDLNGFSELMRIMPNGNMGIGTPNPLARLHVADSNVIFTGPVTVPLSTTHFPPASGAGSRMMWYPQKAAFRVGSVDGTQWDKDSIGRFSFSTGLNTQATGDYSFASGKNTSASGYASTSMGNYTQAIGIASTSMGTSTIANGYNSTSMGFYTTASGESSTSMGYNTNASGFNATSMGYNTNAVGIYSTSMGINTNASGTASTSMGLDTKAKSDNSLVIGLYNDSTNTNRLFEIGNGTSNSVRHNAMTVLTSGNVGIGTNAPDVSALLDISSATQGFLPPRMTIAQRNAISNPAIGLVIFCTDCDELQFYNGSLWKSSAGTLACQSSGPQSIAICNQVWALKNLDVTKYRNGDLIPQVTNATDWSALTTGAWCWYNNDSATYGATYGKLYNWYAVNDSRGLAPAGWHIPSENDWSLLFTCIGGDGGRLKEAGLTHWASPNAGATNNSGFTALPGGMRHDTAPTVSSFDSRAYGGYWWSSTDGTAYANYATFVMFSNIDTIAVLNSNYKKNGYSVRCLRD